MKNKKIVIGLVGQIASGKGAASKYLEKNYKAAVLRFSTMLRDILRRLYLKSTRDNLCILSEILRKNFKEDVMAKVIAQDVLKSKKKLVVVDGIRRRADIKYLKKIENFKLIKITVDPKIRYKRLVLRNENIGDDKKTFKEFLKDQKKEAESEVLSVMEQADIEISNNGSWEDFNKKVKKMIKNIIK
ncbi:MAG: AAA family ATPase [Xanthomonadaceae bacterium]|nr:AAA family ATPase [Rhodospirillaceae bacterium]NIA18132.1 AAA family ATPase [Xanthomonadaceae bacterium]